MFTMPRLCPPYAIQSNVNPLSRTTWLVIFPTFQRRKPRREILSKLPTGITQSKRKKWVPAQLVADSRCPPCADRLSVMVWEGQVGDWQPIISV